MKRHILVFAIAGFISLTACDSGNRGVEDDTSSTLDTATITRGTQNMDTTIIDTVARGSERVTGQTFSGTTNLPQQVRDAIQSDNTLRQKKVQEYTMFTREGRTFYELTFEGDTNKVIFDAQGNRDTSN